MLPLLQLCVPNKLLSQPVGSSEDFMKSIVLLTANLARNSLKHLMCRDFRQFDALVGENCCQLRAYHVQRHGLISQERIEGLMKEISSIRSFALETGFPVGKCKPVEQAGHHILHTIKTPSPLFTTEEKFLFLSHMLFVIRDPTEGRADRSEAKNLRVFLPAEEGQLEEGVLSMIMFAAKRSLAELSVKFAQKLASELTVEPPVKMILTNLMGKENQKTKGVEASSPLIGVPCFFTLFIILGHLQEKKGTLIIRVKQEEGYIDIPVLRGEGPKMIVEGVSERLDREAIQQRGLELILANAAAHPQYFGVAGNNEIPLFERDKGPVALEHFRLFEQYKKQAIEACPLFAVQHIYCEGGVHA